MTLWVMACIYYLLYNSPSSFNHSSCPNNSVLDCMHDLPVQFNGDVIHVTGSNFDRYL